MNTEEAKKIGATHYYDGAYFRFNGKHWYFWNFNCWAITYRDILSFAKPI